MIAREEILQKIERLSIPAVPLIEIPDFISEVDRLNEFKKSLESNGVTIISENLDWYIKNKIQKQNGVISMDEAYIGDIDHSMLQNIKQLDSIEVAIIRAEFGVIENGALWIDESVMGKRILPFIVKHLVVVLDSACLVQNMHEAYSRLKSKSIGFGVFICGPSKTADIEQSLVIGAHGPLSMGLVLEHQTETNLDI